MYLSYILVAGHVTNLMEVPIHQGRSTAWRSKEHWPSCARHGRTSSGSCEAGNLGRLAQSMKATVSAHEKGNVVTWVVKKTICIIYASYMRHICVIRRQLDSISSLQSCLEPLLIVAVEIDRNRQPSADYCGNLVESRSVGAGSSPFSKFKVRVALGSLLVCSFNFVKPWTIAYTNSACPYFLLWKYCQYLLH